MAEPRFEWKVAKIGAGAPPIKTDKGWFLSYLGYEHVYKAVTMSGCTPIRMKMER